MSFPSIKIFRFLAVISAATVFSFSALAAEKIERIENDSGEVSLYRVVIPAADRFAPFVLTIHAGDTVQWTNRDEDDHTLTSVNRFTSPGFRGVNYLIRGTDANHGFPGVLRLRFSAPGTFVYRCLFHSALDSYGQPVAPGPHGGIQDRNGNFGTPMMGVITVLP